MGVERKIIVNGGSDNARELVSGDRYAHVAQTLWAEKDTGTTAGTSPETQYIYTLLANTMYANESSISMVFNGVFADSSGNEKYIHLYFGGTEISFAGALFESNLAWQLRVEVMRATNNIVECMTTLYRDGIAPKLRYVEISGLDLTFNEYEIELELHSPDNAGDVSVHNGRIVYYPAP